MRIFTYNILKWLLLAGCVMILYACSTKKNTVASGEKQPGWVKQAPLEAGKDSVTLVPGANYKAGPVKTFLAGKHYRETWLTPVTVPVFDIESAEGGLKPLKAGGNMQSLVLHMQAANGKRYVLRSVQKNPVKTIPEELRKTFVLSLAQDQVSTMHPYGALAAAQLAEAAGIYHTSPQLVYILKTPALGQFESSHGGMLALFEEKPEDDWSDAKNFGYSKNIIGTEDLLLKMEESTYHRVDERAFARARLLDILIGDWDRSEDQWAWAGFTTDSTTIYRPIPRDRDQAFVKMDGFFPWLFSRKWAARKYQGFDEDIDDMKGLNYNARWIDRSFLTRLSEADWISIADSVKRVLTDEVIEKSIRQVPSSGVYGEEVIAKLKARRDRLVEYAKYYHNVLCEDVDIVGSNGSELFEVQRKKDSTVVKVYRCRITVKGDKEKTLQAEKQDLIYERVFADDETDEVRLYGLGGSDVFEISGKSREGVLVRVIGGEGFDRISDRSEVAGWRKRTKVYDITGRNELVAGDETKTLTSYDVRVNDYDRQEFNYNEIKPKLLVEYNIDDGLYLGGGAFYKNYSFRKKPYSHQQQFVAANSFKTGASYMRYEGDYIGLFRKWDLQASALITPYYATTFFGLGNETGLPDTDDETFNLVRLNQVIVHPAAKRWTNDRHRFSVGPQYRFVQVRDQPHKFISTSASGLDSSIFEAEHYGGIVLGYKYMNVDNEIVPRQGLSWTSEASWTSELAAQPQAYSRFASELSAYIPLPFPLSATLALRIGGASNFDRFEFWQANYLGGYGMDAGNLRGYRRNRFAGRTSAYQNTELRLKLLDFQVYGEAGVFGFIDHGRVWMDNESSGKLHRGYGAGVWAVPFNRLVVTGTYVVSKEDALFNLGMGFFF
jgi:hypothetical protein